MCQFKYTLNAYACGHLSADIHSSSQKCPKFAQEGHLFSFPKGNREDVADRRLRPCECYGHRRRGRCTRENLLEVVSIIQTQINALRTELIRLSNEYVGTMRVSEDSSSEGQQLQAIWLIENRGEQLEAYAGNFFIFMNLSRVASGILCAQAVADNRYKRGWPLGKLPGLKPSMQAIFEIESWLRSMKEFVVAEKEKESLALVKNLNELELYPDEATVREAVPASNQGESDLGLTRGPSLNPVAPEFRPTRTPSPQNNELADVDSQDQEKIRSQMLATLHEAMMEARKKSFQARQERETEAQKRKEMRKREEAHIWVQYWRMSSRLASATTKGRAP